MAALPRIGITCAHERVTYGGWTEDAALVPLSYVRRVAAAGGLPLLLPALEEVSLADVAHGRLPAQVEDLTRDPEAWARH